MLKALCLPVKNSIRGYSDADAQTLSASERRQRVSKRVAYVTRTVYLGIQLVCLVILLRSDSGLGASWKSHQASYAWSFLALLAVNFVLYCALCASNPGFLPVRDADPEQAPLTSAAAEQAGNDTQALLGTPNQRDSYGPLPHPTNYANYINLTALGRDTAESRASSLPWWDLPKPGRWCEYCHAWQELRAKHCHVCARCVRRFDHHCAWTNNCVGEQNHARFWYFLTIQGVLGTWALLDAISAWNLHPQLKNGLLPGFQVLFASVALFLICLFDWGLWIFHTFLLATGRTTNEHVYRRNGPVAYLQHVPRKVSAFDQGIVKNVYNVFCAREAVVYRLPPRAQLIESAQIETVWDNKYYSCCR
ncbi:TPA: hypothetical protein ACH3X3_003440 [Trebouxia sp. C0006]